MKICAQKLRPSLRPPFNRIAGHKIIKLDDLLGHHTTKLNSAMKSGGWYLGALAVSASLYLSPTLTLADISPAARDQVLVVLRGMRAENIKIPAILERQKLAFARLRQFSQFTQPDINGDGIVTMQEQRVYVRLADLVLAFH